MKPAVLCCDAAGAGPGNQPRPRRVRPAGHGWQLIPQFPTKSVRWRTNATPIVGTGRALAAGGGESQARVRALMYGSGGS
jgi:hypothetical protein